MRSIFSSKQVHAKDRHDLGTFLEGDDGLERDFSFTSGGDLFPNKNKDNSSKICYYV